MTVLYLPSQCHAMPCHTNAMLVNHRNIAVTETIGLDFLVVHHVLARMVQFDHLMGKYIQRCQACKIGQVGEEEYVCLG